MRRFLGALIVLGIVALATLSGRAAADTLPPTLTGEFFSDLNVEVINATCNPNGTSTISYYSTGDAVGPYPGTYTESGTVTIGPPSLQQFVNGLQLGTISTIQAFFTIDSSTGQVTGTKQLRVSNTGTSACYDLQNYQVPNGPVISGVFRRVCSCGAEFNIDYDATIKTAAGTFGDSGQSELLLEQFEASVVSGSGGVTPARAFNEVFRSGQTEVTLLPSAGQVTGGGQVGGVVFGLTAKADTRGTKGECTVIDSVTGTKVKCLTATTLVQTGNHATIIGSATVNGIPATYRIDVTDDAEPGRGADTFFIQTSAGYSAGGVLTEGNIQLHG